MTTPMKVVIAALAVVLLLVAGLTATHKPSAEDNRVAQIKKDCYDKMSSDAYDVIAARGYAPTKDQQVTYVMNCETAHGVTP